MNFAKLPKSKITEYLIPITIYFGVIFLVFGFHFNAYNPTMKALFAGVLTDEPFTDTYFLCCIGYNYLWGWLFSTVPSIDWYSLTILCFYITHSFLLLRLLPTLNLENNIFGLPSWLSKIFIQLCFLLPLHFLLDFTIAACIGFVLCVLNLVLIKNTKKAVILLTVLGSLCILLRHDAVLIVLAFIVPVLYWMFKINIRTIVIKSITYLSLLFAILTAVFIININSEALYIKGEPLFYFISDGDLRVQNINQTAEDSIKIKAIERYLLFDSKNIQYDYLKKISITPLNFGLIKYIVLKFDKVIHQFAKSISLNYALVLFWIAMLVIVILRGKDKKSIFLSHLLILIGLYLVTVFIKMEGRILFPIMFVSLLSFYFRLNRLGKLNNYLIIIIAVLSILFVFDLAQNQKNIEIENQTILKQIAENHPGKTILVDAATSNILNIGPFKEIRTDENEFYTVDMGQMTIIPQYQKFLKSKCKCDISSALELFKFIESKNNQFIYISTESRLGLVKQYLSTIYQYNLPFQKMKFGEDNSQGYIFYQKLKTP